MMKKDLLKYAGYVLLTALWGTVAFVLPDFIDSPVSNVKGAFTIVGYLVALGGAQLLLLWLTGLNRWINAFFLPVYSLIGSTIAYYRIAYHVTVTPIILDATFHTNASEAASVMTWGLAAYCIVNLAIAGVLVWWRWKKIPNPPQVWICAATGIVLWGIYYFGNSRLHQSINQRYPYNIAYNIGKYWQIEKMRTQPRAKSQIDVTEPADSLTVVLILGEAIRYDHLSINGYERATTPKIEARENLFSLGDVRSEHTHTLASLPHLLTPADSLHPEWAYTQEGLVAYYKEAGWRTCWISNQDMGETYAHFIQTADTAIFPNIGKSVFVFDRWTDGELLPIINEENTKACKSLIVVHTIGAHWYYANHTPADFEPFSPSTRNRSVTDNTAEEIVNAYDNCVAYLDVVLDSICEMVKDKEAVVIYQSDHGESLGEDGNWLHAAGAEETKHPAGIVWYSNRFIEKYPEKAAMLNDLKGKELSTDYLFPTLMALGGIQLMDE